MNGGGIRALAHDGVMARRLVRATARWGTLLLCTLSAAVAHAVTCGEQIVAAVRLTAPLSCPTGHGLRLAPGVALDCDGHAITGGGQPGQYGIYVDAADGASVTNCIVAAFDVGIRIRSSADVGVYESIAQDNIRYGIEVTQGSTGARIWHNGVHTNGDEGMHISGPAGALAGHQIVENDLDGNALEGIYLLDTHGNIVTGNTTRNHGAAGIYIKASTTNSVADNTLVGDPLQLVSGAERNVLSGNQVVGHKLKFDGASRNLVYTTTVQGAVDAYHFIGASDNRLVDVEAVDPVDHHVRAQDASTGNVFVRMRATPDLRCLVTADSDVSVTDVNETLLACGAAATTTTTTTLVPATTAPVVTTTTTSTTTTSTTLGTAGVTLEIRLDSSHDDAEERSSGSMILSSSDLEMVFDKGDQTVGMRFRGVDVPRDARIVAAHVQFQADERNGGQTDLLIRGEYSGEASVFEDSDRNISSRTPTSASIDWSPPPWTSTGRAGEAERTPDIAVIVQEIIGHPDWQPGNALVILVTGTGERTAESYDGDRAGAPVLHIEY